MTKSKTRDLFAWTHNSVELLLKVTHKSKAVKAAENRLAVVAKQIGRDIRVVPGALSIIDKIPKGI